MPIQYGTFRFGQIVGHPSELQGTLEDIVESARSLAALDRVHGLDLLAYRYKGDVARLMSEVCRVSDKPVVIAGSIDSEDKITAAAHWCIGIYRRHSCFSDIFPADKEGLVPQIRSLMEIRSRAAKLSTTPRRIAVVACNRRKHN